MKFEMIIEDVFQLTDKGFVVSGRFFELNETHDKEEADSELKQYIQKGDLVRIDEEEFILKGASRNAILTAPITYGKTVSLLVGELSNPKNTYRTKTISKITQ